MIEIEPHPLLDCGLFVSEFPQQMGEIPPNDAIVQYHCTSAEAPVSSNDEIRAAVRNVLRHGGFKPTGRSKPASEYLIKAANAKKLGSINMAVDACNAVSLHSGLPISVIDLDRATGPLRIATADDVEYVFNASGQSIKIGGLICLFDQDGPCANAVKDSTQRTLSVVWGTRSYPNQTAATLDWYQSMLEELGVTIQLFDC